jgi:hypothetical protein
MQREEYQTYEIGTRTFFLDRIHGLYDVGFTTRYKGRRTMIGQSLDTPADCYKVILNFLDESTKKQFTHRVVKKLFMRTPKLVEAKL